MDTTTEVFYTVALCDFPALPPAERAAAEVRYSRALERALGTPHAVARAYGAWCCAAEGDGSAEDLALAAAWAKAADAARQAGFRGLSEDEGAYFEVRLG
ncbi:MAG: hypothetical protein V4505_21590 [Pseudomonadota bacterium]